MKKILLTFLVLLVILSGCIGKTTQTTVAKSTSIPQQVSSSKTEYSTVKTKVNRVIDGDTIEVILDGKKTTFRFLLVDTPETKKPNTPVQPWGEEASEFTKKLLTNKEVELEIQSGLDKYQRGLAYVYIDGKSVQEQLLLNGLARVAYVYVKNPPHLEEYQKDEQIAKDKKVGIWSVPNYVQKDGFHPEVVKK